MKLLFATQNLGKVRELRRLLSDLDGLDVVTLADLPQRLELEESGSTFAENATLKAVAAMRATGLPALADDSGLEVDALDGAPGVLSARYAGPDATDEQRNSKLLAALEGVPSAARTARFRCAIALVHPDRPDEVDLCEGICEGRISDRPRGNSGFGYDPLFYGDSLGKTFAEAGPEQKNRLSHRGQAMGKMARRLRERL